VVLTLQRAGLKTAPIHKNLTASTRTLLMKEM
jgi:hypothetical protein